MLSSLISLYLASTININNPNDNSITRETAIINELNLHLANIENKNSSPIKNTDMIRPVIGASSAIAIDLNTGEVLFEKNIHEKRSIASITKLMTATIILDENNLDEIVTVSANANMQIGSTMNLRTGEQISIRNLLYGALVHSGNDAAVALAEHNAGSVEAFVEKMNKKSIELGLAESQFKNPTGLDQNGHYSSSYDIAKLGRNIYQNSFIKEVVQTKSIKVYSADNSYSHNLENTNQLLDSYLNVKGLKTGKTDAAGLCLTAITENNSQNQILTVVLNSPARFKESKILTDWVFRAYTW